MPQRLSPQGSVSHPERDVPTAQGVPGQLEASLLGHLQPPESAGLFSCLILSPWTRGSARCPRPSGADTSVDGEVASVASAAGALTPTPPG